MIPTSLSNPDIAIERNISSNMDYVKPVATNIDIIIGLYNRIIADGVLTGSLVGTSDTQTLTAKTIDDISNSIGANHVHYPVRNSSGVPILAGAVVTASLLQPGTDYLVVEKLTDPQTQTALGVAHSTLADSTVGLCVNTGIVNGIDTSGWGEGVILYPNTVGGFTDVIPTSRQYQACAVVTRSHATEGTLLVEFTEPKKFSSLTQAGYVQLVNNDTTADATKAVTANVAKLLRDALTTLGQEVTTNTNKLAGIEAGATADQTPLEIKTAYEGNANTNEFSDAEKTKLGGVEIGATADQTGTEIKTLYELELDTNAFTDALLTKLTDLFTQLQLTTALGTKVNILDVVNNLISTDVNKPLSAAQGKWLYDNLYAMIGMANGIVPLDVNVLIDPIYLPSYVDDVVEVNTHAALPATGVSGKIYIVVADETQGGDTSSYRWAGTVYALVTNTLTALDILNLLKTVDGAGSGLDADLLDGQTSMYYGKQTDITSLLAITGSAVQVRYDKRLSSLNTIATLFNASQVLVGVRYTGDDNATVYYRDVLTYDVNGKLSTIDHFYGTADLVTPNATTTLTYSASGFDTVTYVEV